MIIMFPHISWLFINGYDRWDLGIISINPLTYLWNYKFWRKYLIVRQKKILKKGFIQKTNNDGWTKWIVQRNEKIIVFNNKEKK